MAKFIVIILTIVSLGLISCLDPNVITRGTNYDIGKNIASGNVTVFEFYADW